MKFSRNWFQTSPHGTARERFHRIGRMLGKSAATGDDDGKSGGKLGEFFRNVAAGARAHDLGDESLYLAEELAELQWSLGGRQKQALALLVLATMISVRQGSSCLPLEPTTNSYLGRLVSSLLRAGKLDHDVQALLGDIDQLARAVTVDDIIHIIGRGNEYRPLIVADGRVYQHRMLWCENRLAARLRERLWRHSQVVFAEPDYRGGDGESSNVVAGPGARTVDSALAEVLARPSRYQGRDVVLSDEQQRAVRQAIRRRFTVISGGPGTGKTAIVVTMLRVLRRLGEPLDAIALAAPTGKAAHRMWTSIRGSLETVASRAAIDDELLDDGVEPQTLHRLLGYLPGSDRFRHHENNPLPASTVIVDEASMIDLVLMERLLRALPADTRLVVLGDADQLPSVDAGAVLRDLVLAGRPDGDVADLAARRRPFPGFALRLNKSYRMDPTNPAGRAILTAAREVNAGNADALLAPDSESPGKLAMRGALSELCYEGIEFVDIGSGAEAGGELSQVHAFVDHWYAKRIRAQSDFTALSTKTYRYFDGRWAPGDEEDLDRLLSAYEKSRLLTVTRRQGTGSDAINRRLHRRVLAESSVEFSPDFYPGEPVMMRRNDYERGLFNGDQGMIIRVSEDRGPQHFRVVFPRGGSYALFHLDALRSHIELAFAMTVHKSQGSEFDEIALILPLTELPLLTREMLYTGITRARRSVVLVGTEELIRFATTQRGQRFSGLADKLVAAPKQAEEE